MAPGHRRAFNAKFGEFGGPGRLVLERPVQRDDMLSGVLNGSAQVPRTTVAARCLDGLDSVPR